MARWFSSSCTPCKVFLKSVRVTIPWLGVYASVDGGYGTVDANGNWPWRGSCVPDRYSTWQTKSAPFGISGAGHGKISNFRTREVSGSADPYTGVEPTYTEVTKEYLWEMDSSVVVKILVSTTSATGRLATWSVPAGLMPKKSTNYTFTDGTTDQVIALETSIQFGGNVPAPIETALAAVSKGALKGLNWGQHSVNGVVSTLSDPSTYPTYIYSQSINATSREISSAPNGQRIFWEAQSIAVLFPWGDMSGCVVDAQTISGNNSTEFYFNCQPNPNDGSTGCQLCYGGCSQISAQSIQDALDPDDGVLYLTPPAFGMQYLVSNKITCPSSVLYLTQSPPCGCCATVCP
jgi:hypothetical protein